MLQWGAVNISKNFVLINSRFNLVPGMMFTEPHRAYLILRQFIKANDPDQSANFSGKSKQLHEESFFIDNFSDQLIENLMQTLQEYAVENQAEYESVTTVKHSYILQKVKRSNAPVFHNFEMMDNLSENNSSNIPDMTQCFTCKQLLWSIQIEAEAKVGKNKTTLLTTLRRSVVFLLVVLQQKYQTEESFCLCFIGNVYKYHRLLSEVSNITVITLKHLE